MSTQQFSLASAQTARAALPSLPLAPATCVPLLTLSYVPSTPVRTHVQASNLASSKVLQVKVLKFHGSSSSLRRSCKEH